MHDPRNACRRHGFQQFRKAVRIRSAFEGLVVALAEFGCGKSPNGLDALLCKARRQRITDPAAIGEDQPAALRPPLHLCCLRRRKLDPLLLIMRRTAGRLLLRRLGDLSAGEAFDQRDQPTGLVDDRDVGDDVLAVVLFRRNGAAEHCRSRLAEEAKPPDRDRQRQRMAVLFLLIEIAEAADHLEAAVEHRRMQQVVAARSGRLRQADAAEHLAAFAPDRLDALECGAELVSFRAKLAIETRAFEMRRRLDLRRPRLQLRFGAGPRAQTRPMRAAPSRRPRCASGS